MTTLRLVLALAATYRLTRLVSADSVWDGTRDKITRWAGRARRRREGKTAFTVRQKIGEWVGCPWCVSMYVAPVVVAAMFHLPGVWFEGPAAVLAASAAAGLLASWEGA